MKSYLEQLTSRALDVAPVLQPRVPTWFEPVNSSTAALREMSIEQDASDRTPMPRTTDSPSVPSRTTNQPAAVPSVRSDAETREVHNVYFERHVESHSVITQIPLAPQPTSPLAEPSIHTSPRPKLPAHSAPTLTPPSPIAVVRDALVPPSSETRLIEVPAAPAQIASVPLSRTAITPPALGTLLPQAAPPTTQAPQAALAAVTPPSRAAAPPPSKPSIAQAQPSLRPTAAPRNQPVPTSTPRSEPPVIEISIGRVDVRAVSPPPPSTPPRSRAAAPMLSLDDYLRHKDGGAR